MSQSHLVNRVFVPLSLRSQHLVGLRDNFKLVSFPLHTEKPEWAAHAPRQIAWACRQDAPVVGLTETRRQDTLDEMKATADRLGYNWFTAPYDPHRNTALLVKKSIEVLDHDAVLCNNNYRTTVTIAWHNSVISVNQMHMEKKDNEGAGIQTHELIEAMTEQSKGNHLSFYMGDANPYLMQRRPNSQPGARLKAAGMPTVWQELDHYPTGLGVNIIGHNLVDTRVKTLSARVYDALGSDHKPAIAEFSIKRIRSKHAA